MNYRTKEKIAFLIVFPIGSLLMLALIGMIFEAFCAGCQ